MVYLKKLKVEYILENDERQDEGIDKIIEEMADELGVSFVGSGYDFKTKIRDLGFSGEVAEKSEKDIK